VSHINHQQENSEERKLYSREVLGLLFKYILLYKKYLFIALLFVIVVTGANLFVPYIYKNIIDRFIFKLGVTVEIESLASEVDGRIFRMISKKSISLTGKRFFIFQAQLKYLSKKQQGELLQKGIISEKRYVLIESPVLDSGLKEKINVLLMNGGAMLFKDNLYLIDAEALSHFSVNQLLSLRANDFLQITRYVLLVFFLLVVQFGASYLQILMLMKLSQNAMKDLRQDLFNHIMSLEVSYYDKNPIGRLVNRVTNDIETLNELFSSVLITLFQDMLLLLGITVIMAFTDLYMAAVVATTFPLIIFLTILFRFKARQAYRVIRTKVADLNSFLNETITGIRIVKIFVQELSNFRRFVRRNTGLYRAHIKQLYIYAVFRPLISFLRWFAVTLVIYFGAKAIVQDTLSFGLLLMFVAYIERFFEPVHDLSEKFDILQSANAAGEKIIAILRADAVKEVLPGEVLLTTGFEKKNGFNRADVQESEKKLFKVSRRFMGEIVFDDVWFSYKPGEWVLRGVSFSVKPRMTVALVGETGAGKTTVIGLLCRFYSHQKGRILIDGMEIHRIPLTELRRNIVPVMQDVFLFSRTVRENIIMGSPYNEDLFKTVCQTTNIDRFIEGLPSGDQEQVMERGVTFSSGEAQLISFTRALYFNPSVLVLDEATSSIDTETERLIQDAIPKLTRGRTSIIIAHRLSTIKNSNRILVLERGKVVEQGSHRELMEKKGLYHKLYTLQFEIIGTG